MRFWNRIFRVAVASACLALTACGEGSVSDSANASSDDDAKQRVLAQEAPSNGVSPSGTVVPEASQIVDATGNVWTIGAGGGVNLNGGQTFYMGAASLILYYNGRIYQRLAANGNWYIWNPGWLNVSGDPRPAGTPPSGGTSGGGTTTPPNADTGQSADGTALPAAALIRDAGNNVWTLDSGGGVNLNGSQTFYMGSASLVLYYNGRIYQRLAANGNWYVWNPGWLNVPGDPRGTTPPAGGSSGGTDTGGSSSGGSSSGGSSSGGSSSGGSSSGGSSSGGSSSGGSSGSGPSASGTSVPGASQIVDASGNVWTIGASGGVNLNGSQTFYMGAASLIVYYEGRIYQRLAANGNWYIWNPGWLNFPGDPRPAGTSPGGNTGDPTPPPADTGVSPDGTTIPSATRIRDSSDNIWTLGVGGGVNLNGTQTFYMGSASLILYYEGRIYQRLAANGNWYKWSPGWLNIPRDPREAAPTPTPPTPVPPDPTPTPEPPPVSNEPTGPVGTLTADTNRPNNSTFVIGEQVVLTFRNSTGGVVNVKIVDEFGNSVASASVPLQSGVGTYTAPSSKYGYFRVNASMASDGSVPAMLGTRPAGFISYAVVPDPALRVDYGDQLSRFGMQGGFAALQGSVIPYLGVRYVLGVPAWSQLEPNGPGQLAARVAAGQLHQKEPILDAVTYNGRPWTTYEIAQVASASIPTWAGPLAGTAGSHCRNFGALNQAGVANLPGFASALGQWFSRSYPNQTKRYYQVTWEPESPWCFGGSAAQLVQYYSLSYAALHAADPAAQVMGPTLFYKDAEPILSQMYAAGFGRYIDAFSIHAYAAFPAETSGLIPALRTQMAQANAAAGKNIPFFGTENGLKSGEFGELNQAYGNVRSEIILLGEGVIHNYTFYIADFWVDSPTETNNTYGYYWNLTPAQPFGAAKIGPKIAAPAYSALTLLLDGSTTKGPMSGLAPTQHGYRFTRDNKITLALWDRSTSTSSVTLSVPAQTLQICDWMANCTSRATTGSLTLTLGQAPVYVIGQGL